MNPEPHLRIAGTLLILLALAHVFFPKRFNWREELARLSLLNRQIFYVHSVFIGVVLLMMGGVSVFASARSTRSPSSRRSPRRTASRMTATGSACSDPTRAGRGSAVKTTTSC